MVECGVFPEGIEIAGQVHREFTLDEQKFRHTLEVVNDPATGSRIEDPVWYSAALLARRLSIPGQFDAAVTPEMVLNLSGADGDELTRASIVLEQRRQAFRSAAQAAPEAAAGALEDGVQSAGD